MARFGCHLGTDGRPPFEQNERTVPNWYSFQKYKTTPAVSLLPAISVRGCPVLGHGGAWFVGTGGLFVRGFIRVWGGLFFPTCVCGTS